ncbi:hypothetical protein ISCGN_001845 [Ixodes scapularis]
MFKTSYPDDLGQAFFGGQYGIPIVTERDDKSLVCRNGFARNVVSYFVVSGLNFGQSSNMGVSILMQGRRPRRLEAPNRAPSFGEQNQPTWRTRRRTRRQGNLFPSGTRVVNKTLKNTQTNGCPGQHHCPALVARPRPLCAI